MSTLEERFEQVRQEELKKARAKLAEYEKMHQDVLAAEEAVMFRAYIHNGKFKNFEEFMEWQVSNRSVISKARKNIIDNIVRRKAYIAHIEAKKL
jgi:hypothetical protein